eukprot:513180_1
MSASYMIIIVILCNVLQESGAMYRPQRPWYRYLVPSCCVPSDEQTIEEQSSNTDSSQNPLSHSYSRSMRSSYYDSGLSATNYLSGLSRLATSVLEPTAEKSKDTVSSTTHSLSLLELDNWNWQHINTLSTLIQSSPGFQERKIELRYTHEAMHIRSAIDDDHLHHATLLVLDGRHTIFDSVPYNLSLVQTLISKQVVFFKSRKHQTLHIIRPNVIRFLQILSAISADHPMHRIIYVNSATMNETEIDDLMSVVTFLEIFYKTFDDNQNEGNHTWQFDQVILNEKECKNYEHLFDELVPVYAYKHLIVVDHHGLNQWKFHEKFYDSRYRNTSAFEKMKAQFIPIQPEAFNLTTIARNAAVVMDDVFDTLIRSMGFDIGRINERFRADFTKCWIKIVSHKSITCDTVLSPGGSGRFETAETGSLWTSPRLMNLMPTESGRDLDLDLLNSSVVEVSEKTFVESFHGSRNDSRKNLIQSYVDHLLRDTQSKD